MRWARTCLFVGALSFFASSVSAAPTERDRERALELFQRGNDAFANDDVEGAVEAYSQAFELSPSYDIACNLGRAEVELKRLTLAAEHLRFCLDSFSASSRPELRAAEQKYRELYRGVVDKLAVVLLHASPDGASVVIDGQLVGRAPLGKALFVEPGPIEVQVSAEKHQPQTKRVEVTAGSSHELTVSLQPSAGEEPPDPASSAPAAEVSLGDEVASGQRIVLGVGAGLSAIGFGAGLWFSSVASEDRDSVAASREACASGGAACAKLGEHLGSANDNEDRAVVAFAAGAGIGAATLLTWLLWPESATQVAVAGSSDGVAIRVGGRF